MVEYPPFPDPYWSYLTPIEKVKCCFWEYVADPVITFVDRVLSRFGKELPEDLRLLPFEMVHGYGIRAYLRLISDFFDWLDRVGEKDLGELLGDEGECGGHEVSDA